MEGKKSIKLSSDTMRRIELMKTAHNQLNVKITRDDIVSEAIDDLMKKYDIKQLETEQEIDKAIMLTNGLIKRAGIKIE